jgi:hypothetical protein
MSCSDLSEPIKMQVYYALKNALGYGNDMSLDDYSRDRFLESVERRDPELVAETLARVRLGLPLITNGDN